MRLLDYISAHTLLWDDARKAPPEVLIKMVGPIKGVQIVGDPARDALYSHILADLPQSSVLFDRSWHGINTLAEVIGTPEMTTRLLGLGAFLGLIGLRLDAASKQAYFRSLQAFAPLKSENTRNVPWPLSHRIH